MHTPIVINLRGFTLRQLLWDINLSKWKVSFYDDRFGTAAGIGDTPQHAIDAWVQSRRNYLASIAAHEKQMEAKRLATQALLSATPEEIAAQALGDNNAKTD